MGDKTGIEWTDATWNPVRGCTRISPGCGGPGPHGGCYAEGIAARFSGVGQPYEGLAHMVGGKPRWTGKLAFVESALEQPIRWRRPRMIFVNSMSDLFHEKMPTEWIDQVFRVMGKCPQHIFQVLTKRPDRMAAYIRDPLPNVWLGTSIEDGEWANRRWESMRDIAGAGWLTWVSYEPALGPVDWPGWEFLKWIVSGGESGSMARPSHPEWHRVTRDFCAEWGIAYNFKQWGHWAPADEEASGAEVIGVDPEIAEHDCAFNMLTAESMAPVGKKAGGRLLDGIEHNEFPKVAV